MKKLLTTLSLLSTITFGTQAQNPCFSAKVNYGMSPDPATIISHDFDGDGKLDIATANLTSGNVSVRLGTGTGTFAVGTNYSLGVSGNTCLGITSGDFNGDTILDLAATIYGTGAVAILLGNGNGTFGASTIYSALAGAYAVVTADFNGDTFLDLAITSDLNNNVAILMGTGTGTFGTPTNYTTGASRSLAIADFNNDGHIDLAVANVSASAVSILLNTGTGTFGASAVYGIGSNTPLRVTANDFNNDGLKDIAVVGFSAGRIYVFLNTGGGVMGTPTNYVIGTQPKGCTSADVNGDGNIDLITATANIQVFLGTGTGTFASALGYNLNEDVYSIVAKDFNGDGKIDLATANQNSSTASILLNCMPPPAPTDITPVANLTICYGETTQLSVSTSVGTISWYGTATGGIALLGNTSFTTPPLTTTTTYYAQTNTNVPSATRTAITVNVIPKITNTQSVALCAGESVMVGTNTYTISGVYSDTLTAFVGCDSIITTTVTVTNIDVSVNLSGTTLTAQQAGATYQWLDCNNNFSPIVGETNSTFTPSANGNYAVEITDNNCTDTSACEQVVGVGLNKLLGEVEAVIFPNPTNDVLTIQTNEIIEQVLIFDAHGRLIQSENQKTFSVKDLSVGVYILQLKSTNKIRTIKLIKY